MDLLPLALAAALDLTTSTPLTEAGRKTQRALYLCISDTYGQEIRESETARLLKGFNAVS